MNEVSDQKAKPDGDEKLVYEGSAARTRATSVEEIMLRRKRKDSLENLGAQLLGNDLVEKASDYHESGKGYDKSKEVSREEGVENSLRKKEDAISNSTEERQDKSRKEDSLGAVQLVGNNLVEKVSDYHESEKGNDRSEKPRHGELVNDSSRNKEEAISSSKDEKLDKEGTVGAATLLGNDLGEKVSDDHASEKGNDKSKKVRHEDRGKDSSRKKEDATSSSKNEGPDKPRKDDHVEAAQLLGNDLVEKVSDCRASDKELEKSKKVSCESVKDSSRKKEEATSRSREERLDKPMTKDPVDKVSDYRASGREHDRSKKLRPEERIKDSSKKKEDTISSSREEKSMKDDPVGAAQLLSNDLVEKVSDYHESKRGYHRSEKLRREEDDKDRLRKKVDANSSCREEKLDKPTKEEEPAGHRKRKAEGEGSRTKEKIVEEHSKDRRIKKEETNSSFREERPDKKMKKEDLAANRKIRVEGEFPTTETKTRAYRDGRGVDTRMKANRERPAEKQIHPQDAGREQGRNALENSASSRKRLRSLVVADIPRNGFQTVAIFMQSGELEKKEPATNALSDNVEDSSNKIFIGGFPKAISSEMLKEIVSVFGPLKAYRFVINNDLNQRCAFLEYIDGSVTLKACAGLNGMKLGGSVITAVCALPDSSSVASDENPPFYGIPEHAKPLLGKPKHILKLKNLVDPEDLPLLSVPEMKEILEDVRLECARFGVIKSINIVKHESKDISGSNTDASLNQESKEMNVSVIQEKDEISEKVDDTADNVDSGEVVRSDSSTGADKFCEPCSVTALETVSQANEDHDSTEQGNSEKLVGESEAAIPQEEVGSARAQDEPEIPQEEVESVRAQDEPENPQEVGSARAVKTRWDSGDKIEEEQDPEDVFEPGCIFIEYGRPEATRVAAHSLHGRLYDSRIVKAEYVSKELYKIRFPSG
ncbi:hypothetical protein HID58_051862 [Brassica napus]|uniref:RRM domain-containing protein n=1 Tax=Brassica napus TaxID=3708 RepID=A0ABQ8AB34_BRANA|nr:hypothetical protein HID58_051862 [Brassica napus]